MKLSCGGLHGWDDVQVQITRLALHGRHEFYEQVNPVHPGVGPIRRTVDVLFDGFKDLLRLIAERFLSRLARLTRVRACSWIR